jgi:cysteine desulfurase/selenocysteine lyase
MEHHSAPLPFREFAQRKGYSFSLVPMTESYGLDLEAMCTTITEEARIVIVTLASNVLGTVNDVKKIVEHAHSKGALVIVDAAQAVGHIPVSVRDLDCDFLAFSGHKMCGPMGTGVLYGKYELLATLTPGTFGGGMVADVDSESIILSEVPHRFEAGTQNVGGVIGLGEAVTYLTEVGVENIAEHTKELTEYAIGVLENIPGIHLYTERNTGRNVGIVSLTLEGLHPHDIAEVCSRENVAVRAGHHCAIPLMRELGISGTIRASFYLYSTKDDVDRLVVAVKKVQEIFA